MSNQEVEVTSYFLPMRGLSNVRAVVRGSTQQQTALLIFIHLHTTQHQNDQINNKKLIKMRMKPQPVGDRREGMLGS